MAGGTVSAEQLRLFIERIERMEEEKRGIADDIKSVYAELRSQGYDAKTVRSIIKLRAMDADTRREQEALLDTYKAALGMLDGTPLGTWAVERLTKKPDPAASTTEPEGTGPDGEASEAEQEEEAPVDPLADVTIEQAHQMGKDAAAAGKPVTSNPFPARDPRRAAWDEAWCGALGSDGMDIPEAWRPKAKPKKGDEEPKEGRP